MRFSTAASGTSFTRTQIFTRKLLLLCPERAEWRVPASGGIVPPPLTDESIAPVPRGREAANQGGAQPGRRRSGRAPDHAISGRAGPAGPARFYRISRGLRRRGLRNRLALEHVFGLEDVAALDVHLADQPQGGHARRRCARIPPSMRIWFKPARNPSRAASAAPARLPAGNEDTAVSRLPEDTASTSWRGRSPVAAECPPASSLDLVGTLAEEDRSPGGDADGDADLAEGVVDPGGHAALLLGHHDTATSAITGLIRPTPAPASRKPPSSPVHSSVAPRPAISSSPSARAPPGRARAGRAPGPCDISAPASAATKKFVTGTGR